MWVATTSAGHCSRAASRTSSDATWRRVARSSSSRHSARRRARTASSARVRSRGDSVAALRTAAPAPRPNAASAVRASLARPVSSRTAALSARSRARSPLAELRDATTRRDRAAQAGCERHRARRAPPAASTCRSRWRRRTNRRSTLGRARRQTSSGPSERSAGARPHLEILDWPPRRCARSAPGAAGGRSTACRGPRCAPPAPRPRAPGGPSRRRMRTHRAARLWSSCAGPPCRWRLAAARRRARAGSTSCARRCTAGRARPALAAARGRARARRPPSAGVGGRPPRRRIELDELVRGLAQERAVVGDEHDAAVALTQQRGEPREA